ncbi:hypothetical protein MNV49_004854 [Pseudohyphozyma bogoriensis]|nr:hypothetical protein MNV49_004854 [Pseudohyphozyma bogoriensis]
MVSNGRLLVLLSLLTVALAVPSQLAFNDASPSLVDSTSSDVQLLTQVDRELRWTYGNCGRTDDPLSIDEITTDRVPPEAGKPATFWVGGKFAKRIERGAYVNLSVERDLGDAVESRLDLCDEVFARKNWMVCPIEPDTFYFREEFTLPTDFWSSLIIEFDAYNRDGQRLGCAEIWFIYGKERLDDSLGSA